MNAAVRTAFFDWIKAAESSGISEFERKEYHLA